MLFQGAYATVKFDPLAAGIDGWRYRGERADILLVRQGTYIPANRQAAARFVIISDEVPAAEIDRMLEIDADESWRRAVVWLAPAMAKLPRLMSMPGISAKLWLIEHIENWNPGLSLSPDELAALARIGIELDVDIYVYEPGELAPIQIPRRVRRRLATHGRQRR